MRTAQVWINMAWYMMDAATCDDSIRDLPARCPECGQPAIFCHGPKKGPFFRSDVHLPSCGLAIGGRKFHIRDGCDIRLKDVLSAEDGPYTPPASARNDQATRSNDTHTPQPEDSPDNITVYGPAILRTCSTIFREIRNMQLEDHITPDLTVKEFVVDERTIQYHRDNGLSGVHLMTGVRFDIHSLEPKLPQEDGYIYLRDPYTWSRRKVIYYKLRCAEPSQNEHFRKLVLSPVTAGRLFAFIGKVKIIPNDTYVIYEVSPLARARYCIGPKMKK